MIIKRYLKLIFKRKLLISRVTFQHSNIVLKLKFGWKSWLKLRWNLKVLWILRLLTPVWPINSWTTQLETCHAMNQCGIHANSCLGDVPRNQPMWNSCPIVAGFLWTNGWEKRFVATNQMKWDKPKTNSNIPQNWSTTTTSTMAMTATTSSHFLRATIICSNTAVIT